MVILACAGLVAVFSSSTQHDGSFPKYHGTVLNLMGSPGCFLVKVLIVTKDKPTT